jgi:threonine/homoserine/homoserine lactone efflux protein
LNPLIAGITMGLAMAAPLGPVNLLVIRSALNHDIPAALANGAGVVLVDTLMSGVAAFALHTLQHVPVDYTRPVQVIGGLMLAALGGRTARAQLVAIELTAAPVASQLGPASFFSPAAIPEQHWDLWPCSRPWREFCN